MRGEDCVVPIFEVGRVYLSILNLALFLPITDASVKRKTNSATRLVTTTDNSFCNTVMRLYTQTTDFIEDICDFHIPTHTHNGIKYSNLVTNI